MLDRREFLMLSGSGLLPRSRARGGVCLMAPGNALAEESWRGYRKCVNFDSPSRVVIVPAFRKLAPQQWHTLREEAGAGSLVILETGLTFASELEVENQRAGLWRHFGIRIAAPSQPPGVRYLHYRWPVDVLVREFGGSVSVEGQAIATLDRQTISVRQNNVIYLGAALGPLLLSGDAQAQAWLNAVTRLE